MTNEEKFKILPFLDRGRWYQLFIENDAGTYKITSGDNSVKDAGIADNVLTFPKDFIIVEVAAEIIPDTETTGNLETGFAAGLATITLPTSIDHAHIFIYGYFR